MNTDVENSDQVEEVTKKRKIYTCSFEQCGKKFPYSSKLQWHMNVHLNKRPYKCTFEDCDKSYPNPKVLKEHILSHHTESKEKKICSYEGCGQTFLKPSTLEWHMNVHLNKRPYKCTFKDCDKSYPNPKVLKEHILSHHTESKEKKFICSYKGCGQTFLKPSTLKWHMNVHSNERPYKCAYEDCDKSYNNPSHLKRHTIKHDTKLVLKKYRCKICKEFFSYSGNLQRHIKNIHTSHGKYCLQCKKSFRKENLYEEHMINFHKLQVGELKCFECEQCGAVLRSYKAFKKHKSRHLNKRFACYVKNCSEEFYTINLLNKHLKARHVFQYTCDHCNKSFYVKSQLRKHILTHMENRKIFHCIYNNCDRMYFFKKNLTQHIRSFHLGKKFKCDICNLELSSKQKLDQHRQKVH